MVEVLAPRLKNERAIPKERYYHAAFLTFPVGTPVRDLPLEAGWWALAYREVEAATGQQTRTTPLGVVKIALGHA